MAFDALHQIRTSRRIPAERVQQLALMLDLGACANATSDNKRYCSKRFHITRWQLENAGLGDIADHYWQNVFELERRRPLANAARGNAQRVRSYREDVVRLSLGVLTATAFGLKSLEEGIQAVRDDDDLNVIFKIVMQCQIIDDLIDYSKDVAAGLPGFLTASESLLEAFEVTYQARRDYATIQRTVVPPRLFCFEITLMVVSAFATILVTLGRWRQRIPCIKPLSEEAIGPL